MFREFVLCLAKFIFMLKFSKRLHRYILCGGVAAVLPHHRIIYNDVISQSVLKYL
jgi:hypothetical protein